MAKPSWLQLIEASLLPGKAIKDWTPEKQARFEQSIKDIDAQNDRKWENDNRDIKWLNGWNRDGGNIIINGEYHCVGCGDKKEGFDYSCDDQPDKLPDFPFPRGNCPVCNSDYDYDGME